MANELPTKLVDSSSTEVTDPAAHTVKVSLMGGAAALGKVDDSGFTPATDAVMPVGAVCDDVATDAVDEGDVGAVRMGSDRVLYTKPPVGLIELGLTELIDKDEQVDQNEYSKSVGVALSSTFSGEILQISVYATETGTGAVPANSGILLIFDADPTVAAGDAALTLADWQSCIAKVFITDWTSDAGGGMAVVETSIAFHAVGTLYFVFKNLGTSINDAAGDDEEIHVNAWIRREN